VLGKQAALPHKATQIVVSRDRSQYLTALTFAAGAF
jgi:hypothetical protein